MKKDVGVTPCRKDIGFGYEGACQEAYEMTEILIREVLHYPSTSWTLLCILMLENGRCHTEEIGFCL